MQHRLHLTFPRERVARPLMCQVAKQFDVIFSIRRANVGEEAGWIDLEFDGDESELEKATNWLQEKGVRVDPIEGDIVAG